MSEAAALTLTTAPTSSAASTSAPGDTALTAAPAAAPSAAPAAAPAADPAAVVTADPAAAPDPAKPAEARAPAEYADFNLGDGKTLPPEVAAKVKEIAKDMDLTQEQAQKLVELNLKQDMAQTEQLATQSQQWLAGLPSDKEFGGDKFSENMAIAKKAIDAFGSPELKSLLDQTKLGNHPELIRAFYRAGQAISQDTRFVAGGSGNQPASRSAAASLYPNQKAA